MNVIETLVSASPGSALAEAMEKRAEILRLSQAAHDAVLLPRNPGGLSYGLRAALAARMSRQNANEDLAAHYETLVARAAEPETSHLVDPSAASDDLRTAAIVRHADMLTVSPRNATRADIDALRDVGFDDADIVRLSELAAFVSYQVRVIAGMKLIGRRT